MKTLVRKAFTRLGYEIVPARNGEDRYPPDISAGEREIFDFVSPYTMTGIERVHALINAVNYVLDNNIKGDFVECGVWRGGSAMVVAKILQDRGIKDRKLYLYDTFEGMSAPTGKDVDFEGVSAESLMEKFDEKTGNLCYADKRDVLENIRKTGYPDENFILVEGKVEDTIPETLPERISLLRLDTDWYESTSHELKHLYPKLSDKGVLIIDDYGHWRGAREATDEFFAAQNSKPLLHRIDYTGRIMIKI